MHTSITCQGQLEGAATASCSCAHSVLYHTRATRLSEPQRSEGAQLKTSDRVARGCGAPIHLNLICLLQGLSDHLCDSLERRGARSAMLCARWRQRVASSRRRARKQTLDAMATCTLAHHLRAASTMMRLPCTRVLPAMLHGAHLMSSLCAKTPLALSNMLFAPTNITSSLHAPTSSLHLPTSSLHLPTSSLHATYLLLYPLTCDTHTEEMFLLTRRSLSSKSKTKHVPVEAGSDDVPSAVDSRAVSRAVIWARSLVSRASTT